MEFQEALDAVLALPLDDQVLILHEIEENIRITNENYQLTPEQKMELDRRIAQHEAHPETAIPWKKFQEHMREKLQELDE